MKRTGVPTGPILRPTVAEEILAGLTEFAQALEAGEGVDAFESSVQAGLSRPNANRDQSAEQ